MPEPATKATKKPTTLRDCDRNINGYWRLIRDDPNADAGKCREQIDLWLDARLVIMRHGVTERMED